VHSAVESMRTGATDYLTKPFALDELAQALARAGERRNLEGESRKLRELLRSQQGLGNIIGRSPEMDKLYRILAKVAQSSHPAVIVGEPGVGKELIARAIHDNGSLRSHPFLAADCGSLAPALIENELFGYAKGAFAGATRHKDGLLVAAEGGTVLLDDIGELSLDLQARLLRALQEKEIRPSGSLQRIPINVRILAATSQDLPEMVEQGRFRKDLYYRLNVVNLRIPPLRERKQDIPLLAAHFLGRVSRETGTTYTLSDDTLRTMMEYDWPGNVRELENSIERACTLSSGPILHTGDLPTQLQNFRLAIRHSDPPEAVMISKPDMEQSPVRSLAELEKQAILDTLRKLDGDKIRTARLLGIGKTTLYRKLKEYGIGEGMMAANGE
jgi:DNA-binding NtrC family response regulator